MLGDQVQDDLLGSIRAPFRVQTTQVGRIRIDGQHTLHEGIGAPRLDFGVVRPTQLHHHDRLVGVGRFPLLSHLGAHRKGNASLVAARHRDAGVGQRAEEGRHDDVFIEGVKHTRLGRVGVPDVQRGRVHALRHDLVNVLGHNRPIGLAVEGEHLGAILFHGVPLGLGELRLVEHVGQVRHKERDLHWLFRGPFSRRSFGWCGLGRRSRAAGG